MPHYIPASRSAIFKLPTENDLPELVTIHVSEGPSGPIPYQGKGIGEAPIGGVAPATGPSHRYAGCDFFVNLLLLSRLIEDAVGVRITDLPISDAGGAEKRAASDARVSAGRRPARYSLGPDFGIAGATSRSFVVAPRYAGSNSRERLHFGIGTQPSWFAPTP